MFEQELHKERREHERLLDEKEKVIAALSKKAASGTTLSKDI